MSLQFSLDVKTDSGDHKKVKIEVVDDDKVILSHRIKKRNTQETGARMNY